MQQLIKQVITYSVGEDGHLYHWANELPLFYGRELAQLVEQPSLAARRLGVEYVLQNNFHLDLSPIFLSINSDEGQIFCHKIKIEYFFGLGSGPSLLDFTRTFGVYM